MEAAYKNPKSLFIGNSFDHLNEMIASISHSEVFIVIDRKVDQIYGRHFPYDKMVIDAVEANKSLDTVNKILSQMVRKGLTRDSFVLGVGGGVTTDLVGFAASIYKRGVKFAFVPTTLLAQVDASIGGKNGINLLNQKNMVGLFSHPEFIYTNVSTLMTLEKRELISGMAEMLKTFIIGSKEEYVRAIEFFSNRGAGAPLSEGDLPVFAELIRIAAQIKGSIVMNDEKDRGERRKLNLGHTFGHVIEMETGLRHGEAIALGMILSSMLANLCGYSDKSTTERLVRDFESVGLPADITVLEKLFAGVRGDRLMNGVQNDKKVGGDRISFVFIKEPGDVLIKEISIGEIEEMLKQLFG